MKYGSLTILCALLSACGGQADQGPGPNQPNGAQQPYGAQQPSGAQQPYGTTTTAAPPPGAQVPSPTQMPVIPEPPDNGTWSLLQRQQWHVLAKEFTEYHLDGVNRVCNTRIEGAFDFESFRGHFSDSAEHPLGVQGPPRDHMEAPFAAVHDICGNGGDMEKNTVRAKIRRIEVHWVSSGNSSFTFMNGVVSASMNPADGIDWAKYRDFIIVELKKRL